MNNWRTLLVFLVLSISSISRGQNGTSAVTQNATSASLKTTGLTATPGQTSANQTDSLATVPTTLEGGAKVTDRTTAALSSVSNTIGLRDGGTLAITRTSLDNTSTAPGTKVGTPSSWGYVVLTLIILVIIVLSLILYFLRRAAQTYSFDLHSAPASRPNQPVGTFERVRLDDLDRKPASVVTACSYLPSPTVSNGSTRRAEEEPRANGESVPPEAPDASGPQTPPTADPGDPGPSLGSLVGCTNLFFDAVEEEQQNENNNNPSAVCSRDPFVEINLDEAALCHQLLTPPQAPASVLPFTPFSFSSSSSSSSSSISLHIQ
ncbi:uncharacterized protein LOC119223006 [Pungitius pungitius]|uniref:uncharacterized protein LOC119223006 n=1 Tax=Pungitius pungitius TaxID=134920 RepID=UPI002E15D2D8